MCMLRDPILRFWLNVITFYERKSHLQGLYQLNDVNLCNKCFVIAFLENRRVLHYHYGSKRKHPFQNQMDSFRKHYNYYLHFIRWLSFPFLNSLAEILEYMFTASIPAAQ